MYRTMSPIYLSLKLHKTSTLGALFFWFFKEFAATTNTHSTIKLFLIYFLFCCHMPRTCFYCVFSYYGFKVFIVHILIIQYTLKKYPIFDIGGLVRPWFVNRGFGISYITPSFMRRILFVKTLV